MFEVTKEFEFCAAHYLPSHDVCGKMHGHNYRVLVTFMNRSLDKKGMVLDFKRIKEIVAPVITGMDHGILNELMPMSTAEYIAKYIFNRLFFATTRTSARIKCVTVFETPTSSARYSEC